MVGCKSPNKKYIHWIYRLIPETYFTSLLYNQTYDILKYSAEKFSIKSLYSSLRLHFLNKFLIKHLNFF